MSESTRKFTEADTMGTGWSFDCVIASAGSGKPGRGGLVLKNIRHQGYNYAKEMRVAGIRVNYMTVDKKSDTPFVPESMVLELGETFFEVSEIKVLSPKIVQKAVPLMDMKPIGPGTDLSLDNSSLTKRTLGFRHYPFMFGLEVTYTSRPSLFDKITNFDKKGLVVTQTILFSHYSNKPSHEPTGGLSAARIHPLVTTKFTGNKDFDKKLDVYAYANGIRYDYYIHLSLDRILSSMDSPVYFPSGINYGNSAAVFKDNEGTGLKKVGEAAKEGFVKRIYAATEKILFAAVEKPIVKEICAYGLRYGVPFTEYKGKPEPTWDNIHWWGTHQHADYTISAPGAFHAAHIHWRWGGVALSLSEEPQYLNKGLPANSQFAQALVDPTCAAQTIQFAIVHHQKKYDHHGSILDHICREKFSDVFGTSMNEPGEIPRTGFSLEKSNLVMWYSVTAEKLQMDNGVSSGLDGTLFLHGMFFPHEFDPIMQVMGSVKAKSPTIGDKQPLYYPSSKEDILSQSGNWERY